MSITNACVYYSDKYHDKYKYLSYHQYIKWIYCLDLKDPDENWETYLGIAFNIKIYSTSEFLTNEYNEHMPLA